jgi:hypothetical protein
MNLMIAHLQERKLVEKTPTQVVMIVALGYQVNITAYLFVTSSNRFY